MISDVDGIDHDGFHVMKMIARYNPDLPLLLVGQPGDYQLAASGRNIQIPPSVESLEVSSSPSAFAEPST